ncbi:MAG: YceI family protein [Anaerolineaceae bacterium]|nr:YceI family protein [Anaerolineaceae bacterium]
MFRGLQMLIFAVAVIAIVSIAAFLYLTREIAAPSVDIASSVQTIAPSSSDQEVIFNITPEETTAEYSIYESLNGADKTVIGTTNQVTGEIMLNLNDVAQSRISELCVNARTFATDSDHRDNAVARLILQSEDAANECVLFQPNKISGLLGSVSVGDTLTFQVTGDLTIAGVTQSMTFAVTATLQTAEELTGHAETVISRADFNLQIPEVVGGTTVGDAITLKLDFVAMVNQ